MTLVYSAAVAIGVTVVIGVVTWIAIAVKQLGGRES